MLKESVGYTLENFLVDRPIDIVINNAGVGSTNQHISGNSFIKIIKYDKKVFDCFINVFLTSDVQNVSRTWVSEDKE